METPNRCPNCEVLEKRVRELEAQGEALQKQMDEVLAELRKGKRQAHPFGKSSDTKGPKKKPGRQPGKGTFRHREPPEQIDRQIPVPLDACPDCQGPLKQKRQHRHWQTELPEIQPEVTQFDTESGWCTACRKRVRSQAPKQLVTATGAAAHGIGPHLAALAAKLKHENGLPYRQISELCQTLFGIQVTPGALAQGSQRVRKQLDPVYQELKAKLCQASTVHSDGTGWKIGTENACLWVFGNTELTLYTIDRRFGHGVVLDVLTPTFAGVLVSDRHGAYSHALLKQWKKQKCNLHIVRNIKKLLTDKTRGAANFGRDLLYLIAEAMDLARRRSEVPDFGERAARLKDSLSRMLSPHRRWSDPDNQALAAALFKDLPHLLRYLDDPDVSATNNQAERDLRPAVIVRKIGRCNKTHAGAAAHAGISSILSTLRKQGFNSLCGLRELLSMPSPAFDTLTVKP